MTECWTCFKDLLAIQTRRMSLGKVLGGDTYLRVVHLEVMHRSPGIDYTFEIRWCVSRSITRRGGTSVNSSEKQEVFESG